MKDCTFIVDNDYRVLEYFADDASILNVTNNSVKGKPLFEVMPVLNNKEVINDLKNVRATNEPFIRDVEYSTTDGSTGWYRLKGSAFYKNGKIKGQKLVVDEVTQVKQIERQQLLQEKMASLSKLAANIAHEINNPLEAILNRIGCLLMEDFDQLQVDKLRRELELIQEQVYQISSTTNALVAFSKNSKENFRPQDINSIVSTSIELCRMYRETAKIEFRIKLDDKLPPVLGNEVSLEQCFVNILNNAIDAIQDRGKITVTTKYVPNSICGQVHVTIADTGIGINTRDMEYIFDPFYTTKKQSRGTGLGLSIAYGIITDHRGKIEVKSRLGKNSQFILKLPITEN